MNRVSMQLYAREKLDSARAEADIQRELDKVNKAKKISKKPFSLPETSIPRLFMSSVGRVQRLILLIPSFK